MLLGPVAPATAIAVCLETRGMPLPILSPLGLFFGCATCQILINCLEGKVMQPGQNMKYGPLGFPTSPLFLDRETPALDGLFAGNFSTKSQRFGSESAGVAPRTRKIQLPREGTQQRFSGLEKFPPLPATRKELFCFPPFRMPLNPFSLQLGTPRSPVQQVFQSRPAQVTALDMESCFPNARHQHWKAAVDQLSSVAPGTAKGRDSPRTQMEQEL